MEIIITGAGIGGWAVGIALNRIGYVFSSGI
jgi:hypothetical protein